MMSRQKLHLLRQGLHLCGGISYCPNYSVCTSTLASGVLSINTSDSFRCRRPIERTRRKGPLGQRPTFSLRKQ